MGITKHVITLTVLCVFCLTTLAAPSMSRQNELRHMVKHDCGSCHGFTLQGGLGPTLRPQFIAPKGEEYLMRVIKHGIAGSAMPAWSPMLSDSDITYIVYCLLAFDTMLANKNGASK